MPDVQSCTVLQAFPFKASSAALVRSLHFSGSIVGSMMVSVPLSTVAVPPLPPHPATTKRNAPIAKKQREIAPEKISEDMGNLKIC
jgi:hypothetical protein